MATSDPSLRKGISLFSNTGFRQNWHFLFKASLTICFGVFFIFNGLVCWAEPMSTESSSEATLRVCNLILDSEQKNLGMVMRSNSSHYWSWVESSGSQYLKDAFAQLADDTFVGPVSGDPHQENFAILNLGGQFEFVLNDFDDAGRAPLFLDFAKFVVITKAITEDLNSKFKEKDKKLDKLYLRMLLNYIRGLAGYQEIIDEVDKKNKLGIVAEATPPEIVSRRIGEAQSRFEKDRKDRIKHYLTKNREAFDFSKAQELFDFGRLGDSRKKVRELVAKSFYEPKQAVDEAFVDKLVDKYFAAKDQIIQRMTVEKLSCSDFVAGAIKDTGGSRGMLRILLYCKAEGDPVGYIMEFKQLKSPGVSELMPQIGAIERLLETETVYWVDSAGNQLTSSLYGTMVSSDGTPFNFRPKLKSYNNTNVKVEDMTMEELYDLVDLSLYISLKMGQWHSRALGAKAKQKYIELLSKDDAIPAKNQLKDFVKAYIELVLSEMDDE